MSKSQLKKGILLSYVVIGLNTIVGLSYTPYMLRMLGKNEYGLYSLVISVIGYLTILDLGFGNAIVRYTAKYRAEGKLKEQYSMFGMFLLMYSGIGVVALLIGLFFYFNVSYLFGNTMTEVELTKAGIMVLIMVFNLAISFPFSIFGSIITAYEKFVFQKSIQILRIVLNTLIMVLILEMGYRAIGMVVVVSVFNVLTLFINYIYCKFKLHIKIVFKKIELVFFKEIAIYSFYIFLGVIMDKIYWSSGQFILGAVIGTAAIAVFAVAIQLQGLYMSFSQAVTGVFLPKITGMVVEKNSETAVSEVFIKTGRIQFIVMSFILTGFILFGKNFVILWAGKGYEKAYYMALLFFIPLTVPLIQNLGIAILQARNQMKFRSIMYFLISILSIVLQIPLAKKFGGIGIAIAISISIFLGQIIVMNIYYHIKQKINILKFWSEIFKMAIAPILVGALIYYLKTLFPINTLLEFLIGILFFAFLYIPCFWFFSMNKYEKNIIIQPLKRILKLRN